MLSRDLERLASQAKDAGMMSGEPRNWNRFADMIRFRARQARRLERRAGYFERKLVRGLFSARARLNAANTAFEKRFGFRWGWSETRAFIVGGVLFYALAILSTAGQP